MSTRYNHKDNGTTELRNYGATELRNYGTTELRRCADTEVRNQVDGSEMARRWLEDGSKIQASKHTPSILNEYGKSMGRVWLECVLVVLMMVVESTVAWADDYSGTYYLANNNLKNNQYDYKGYDNANNFYFCPAEVFYNNGTVITSDNEKPFLTTYQTGQTDEALWIVEKVTDTNYYTFKQKVGNSYRYLTVHNKLTNYSANRMRVHLEELTSLDDHNYFTIELITTQDGIKGYTIGCVDAYKDGNNQYLNPADGNKPQKTPTSAKANTGGMVGYYTKGVMGTDASGSIWFFEVPKPVINIDENYKLTFSCASDVVTIHYTIDGGDPSTTGMDDIYTDEIQLTEGVHTIKAIAVMNSGNTGYASGVITKTVMIFGTNSYLIQSVECTDFYMIPGDVKNGNMEVNTSSLFRSTMAWKFSYAGKADGILYYYIMNGTSYLYRTGDNVYMKTSSDFDDSDGYKFSIEGGYDADSNPDGFHIIPKGVTDNTYCIYKGGWNSTTLANSKADVMKGSTNARKPEYKHTRWNFIPAPGDVLPSSLTYDSSNSSDPNWPAFLSVSSENPIYFKIENVGTAGRYMNDTSPVGTATTGSDDLAWYIIEAEHDNWRKYYYIINKKTGKYLKFNQTIPATPSSMGGKSNVLSLLDYDSSASDRHQFVFAKSTIDGAYYIVPKGLEDATYNNYYALYLDSKDETTIKQPVKSTKNRQSDSYKWKLVPFCANPIFAESEGVNKSITLSCATTGAEIHYTDDGTEPDGNSTTYSSGWSSSNQVCIKAIGVIKDGGVVVSKSEVVTLLNKPDVTLESGFFVYEGRQLKPEVNSVKVGTTEAPTSPATYTNEYHNNIDAGTASVDIADADENDNWYIWNVPTTNFTINKKTLTVRADNKTVEYSSAPPTYYSISYSDWADGDIARLEGIDTKPTATCTGYTTTSAVGSTHQIIPSGGVDNNYDFEYVNGTLTVAAAFVTLTANSRTVTYDGTEQTVTGFTCSVDGLSFTNAGVSASGSGTDVGTYDVTFSGVTLNSTKDNTNQYVVTNIVEGTLTINPAAATVTADSKTKTYGDVDPELTATVSGMVNGESTDLISRSLSRAAGNNVGDYAITPTGDAIQGNYTVSYIPGTLTINQKELTITAQDQAITYGETPNNSVTYSGFITGESENTTGVFTGTLVYSYNSQGDGQGTSYTTTIPTGTTYIIPSGLSATNYTITYVAGELTVDAKSIGNGSIASGFTLNFGEGGAIILKDGETDLYLTTDYTIGSETTSSSGRYSEKTVSGTGNYTGSISIRNAIVNFQTDDDQEEWSATFIAEPAGNAAADNTKGHKLPDGVRAYIITSIEGNWVIPEALNYIPEGIPVLLVSDKASGGFLVEDASNHTPITTTGEGNQKDANMLEEVKEGMAGYVTDTESPNYKKAHFNVKTIYLLSYNEFVHNMDGYLSKGKVFLNPNHPTDPSSATAAPSPAPMRMRINWDIVNGIKDIPDKGNTEEWNSGKWYGIDGRPLNGTPTRKGLYFHNGKKVIIKEDL